MLNAIFKKKRCQDEKIDYASLRLRPFEPGEL
jgi:hypothetical protein